MCAACWTISMTSTAPSCAAAGRFRSERAARADVICPAAGLLRRARGRGVAGGALAAGVGRLLRRPGAGWRGGRDAERTRPDVPRRLDVHAHQAQAALRPVPRADGDRSPGRDRRRRAYRAGQRGPRVQSCRHRRGGAFSQYAARYERRRLHLPRHRRGPGSRRTVVCGGVCRLRHLRRGRPRAVALRYRHRARAGARAGPADRGDADADGRPPHDCRRPRAVCAEMEADRVGVSRTRTHRTHVCRTAPPTDECRDVAGGAAPRSCRANHRAAVRTGSAVSMIARWEVPDAATLGQLLDHPPAGFHVSAPESTYFRDVYCDTSDGELRQRGGRYRMRFTADGAQRVTAWLPDGTRLEAPELARLRAVIDPARLAPWIEWDVSRRWRSIAVPLVLLPLCDIVSDAITVRRGELRAPLWELSLRPRTWGGGGMAARIMARRYEATSRLRPLGDDPLHRAQAALNAAEAQVLAGELRGERELAFLAVEHGRLGLCRLGAELRVPLDHGSGEAACCAASWAVVRVSCGCWASCPRPATARRSKSGRRGVWAERVIRRCNGSPRPSCWTASGRRCCATPRPWPRSPSRRARRSSPNGRAWPSGRVTRPTISRLRTSRAPGASRSASCEPRSWHRTGSIPRGRHRSSSSIRSCRGSSSTPACWPWPRIRAHRRPRGSASLGSSRPIWTTSWRRRSVP